MSNRFAAKLSVASERSPVTDAGTPTIATDNAYRWGWLSGGAWRFAALTGSDERFASVAIDGLPASAVPRVNSDKQLAAGSITDTGSLVRLSSPLRINGLDCIDLSRNFYGTALALSSKATQYSGERVLSNIYLDGASVTVTSVTAETSLLNGSLADGGWRTGVCSALAGRFNFPGANMSCEMLGHISSGAGATATWTIRRNGVAVASTQVTGQNFGTNTMWRLEFERPTITIGTGTNGAIRVVGRVKYTASNANGAVSATEIFADITGVDTSVQEDWDVTFSAGPAVTAITKQFVKFWG